MEGLDSLDPGSLDIDSLITGSVWLTVASIVITVGSLAACWYLARRKGRDIPLALLSGCTLGPLAVIYYALAKPPKSEPQRLRESPLPPASPLSQQPMLPLELPADPPEPPPLAKCWSCSYPYPPGRETCPACGIKLDY